MIIIELSIPSSENFSVILAEDLEKLQMIQAEINSSSFLAKLEEEENRPIRIRAGDKVLARFPDDGQLYRAEIVDPDPGAGLFKVFYCDFGNAGNTEEVYPLPENLKKIQGFSIRCCLACSIGDGDREKAHQEFAGSIQSSPRLVLQVFKVKKTCLEVDLVKVSMDGDMISIRDYLVFLRLAYFAPRDEISTFPNIFRKTIQNQQLDFNIGEIHKGIVGHIPFVHPGDWVQISVLVSSAVPVYRLPRSVYFSLKTNFAKYCKCSLMEKMQRTYSHPKSESLWGLGGLEGFVNPGTVCAAQDEEDRKWYRAMVVKNVRGRIYTIRLVLGSVLVLGCIIIFFYSLRYVDFGEKRILSVYSLRRLFPEFRDALPEMARTVAIPVKVDTDAQARRVNAALRQTLMNQEVGFQVREVKDELMLVDMDYEGEEIKEVVDYLKIGRI